MKIAVAGTGYVGLSLAVLLSQHNEVSAVDIVPEKVEINKWISPIQDEYIEKYFAEHEQRKLNLKATTNGKEAYTNQRPSNCLRILTLHSGFSSSMSLTPMPN